MSPYHRLSRRKRRAVAASAFLFLAVVPLVIIACSTGAPQPTPGAHLLNGLPETVATEAFTGTTAAPLNTTTSYYQSPGGLCVGSSASQVGTCGLTCYFSTYNCPTLGVSAPPGDGMFCPTADYTGKTSGAGCGTGACEAVSFGTTGQTCPSGFYQCGHCAPSPPPKNQKDANKEEDAKLVKQCVALNPKAEPANPGMCAPNANLMLATLNLNDTPVGYAPQKGSPVYFTLTYNHDPTQTTTDFTSVGLNWTHSFVSYIQDDPATGHEGLSVMRYALGGGAVDESAEAGGYSSGAFPAELQGGAVLTRSPATGTLDHYMLTLVDGSVQTFNVQDGATTAPRRVFLSSIADPQGNTLTLGYNTTTSDAGVVSCPTSAPGCRLQTITDAESRTTSFCYNANADAGNCLSGTDTKIYSITDPFGRQAVLTYDTTGSQPRLSTITDVLGITSTLTYDSGTGADLGFIQKLHTPYGDSTFAGGQNYDANTRWLTITDAVGNTQRVEFDGNAPSGTDAGAGTATPGTMTADPTLGTNNTFVWDNHAYATDGAGSLSYADARQYHWLTNRLGNTSPVLGAMKQPKENFVFYNYADQPSGGVVGAFDKPIYVGRILDDGSSAVSSFTYDATTHLLTASADPTGRSLHYSYGGTYGTAIDLTQVQRLTAASTYTTIAAFTYNTSSAPLHVPLTAVDAASQTTTLTYTTAGQLATATDPLSHTTTFNHDTTGRLTTIVDVNSVAVVTNAYPACSSTSLTNCDLPSSVTDSEGRVVNYTRDTLDRVTLVGYPGDGTSDSYDWTFQSGDPVGTAGNPSLEVRKYTDRLARVVTYGYDRDRRLTSVVEPTSGSSHRTTSYAYDHDEALQSQTDGNGNITLWTFDIQSRPLSKTYGSGTGVAQTESYGYETTTSRLKTVTDPLSEVKTYAYDKANALTGITYTSSVHTTPNVTFAYDTWFPRVTSMADGIGTTTWSYVAIGTNGALQLLTEDGPFSGTADSVTYGYDADGRENARTISGGNETLAYDSIGRVTTHGTSLGSFSYGYNGETAAPTSRSVTNGSVTVSTAWAYDNNSNDRRLTGITNKIGSTTVRGYTYSWGTANDAGVSSNPYDITGIAETAGAGGSWAAQSWTYAYDLRDRLTSATTGSPTSWNFAFTRDNSDNITAATRNVAVAGWSSYTPNALNQRASGTGAPTYDANGNITNDYAQYKQQWDAENRMTEADFLTAAGASTVTGQETKFQYDGLGRRLVETQIATNGSTSYILRHMWCGGEICQTRYWNGSTETVTRRYYPEGEHELDTSKEYVRMPDQLGSVRDSVDAIAGTVAFSLDFGPEGEQLRTNGSAWPDHRYAGQYNRGPLNSNLTRYRNYNSNLVSWSSRDPIGERGGINTYGYVGGNPVMGVDPLGLDTFIANRDFPFLGTHAEPRWMFPTHTFVFTTNPDGTIAHTYSWGSDPNPRGWNIDAQQLEIDTAQDALANGWAERVGDSSLDPYVRVAADGLNHRENEHMNGWLKNTCKTEADNLVDTAKQLQLLDRSINNMRMSQLQ